MFICSVSTVMFNGNPLLRFDGYYILMDILEIPIFAEEHGDPEALVPTILFGTGTARQSILPHRNQFWFALYTIAAVIYRWVVVFSIIIFLSNVLEPYGLKSIGRLIAVSGLVGMIVQHCGATIKFFRTPGRASKMKRNRVIGTTVIATILLAAFAFLPLPFHVDCAMEILPENAAQVFAMVPGHLVSFNKKPGDHVEAGEPIAQLDNNDVRLQVMKTWGELRTAQERLRALEESKFQDSQALALLQVSTEVVQSKSELYSKANERADLLTFAHR